MMDVGDVTLEFLRRSVRGVLVVILIIAIGSVATVAWWTSKTLSAIEEAAKERAEQVEMTQDAIKAGVQKLIDYQDRKVTAELVRLQDRITVLERFIRKQGLAPPGSDGGSPPSANSGGNPDRNGGPGGKGNGKPPPEPPPSPPPDECLLPPPAPCISSPSSS